MFILLRYCRKFCQFPVLPSSAEIRQSMIYFGIIRHSVCLSVCGMEQHSIAWGGIGKDRQGLHWQLPNRTSYVIGIFFVDSLWPLAAYQQVFKKNQQLSFCAGPISLFQTNTTYVTDPSLSVRSDDKMLCSLCYHIKQVASRAFVTIQLNSYRD